MIMRALGVSPSGEPFNLIGFCLLDGHPCSDLFWAVEFHVIAHGLPRPPERLLVVDLDLLQADHIRLGLSTRACNR